jgi:uncharacterized repeat protein (TIGR01451 family)
MSYTIKKQKIWMAVISVTIPALVGIIITLSPSLVTAQEPEDDKSSASEGFSKEALAPFEEYVRSLNVEKAGPFDLQVTQQVKTPAVTSGNFATFVITIRNNGPNAATLVQFYDNYPTQMSQVNYQFSVGNVVSNGFTKPTWLFLNPISSSGQVVVTVTGRLTSIPSVNVTNVAEVFPYTTGSDPTLANNQASGAVALTGSNPGAFTGPLYFPLIFKFPQPTLFLIYTEDFEDSDAWAEFSSDNCDTENEGGRYVVNIEGADEDCLPAADNGDDKPEQPFRETGEFEVEVYRSEGGGDDFSYGIFINGEGGDNYYLFRVWPNTGNCSSGGRWALIRREEGDDETKASGSCNTAIKRGSSVNRLRIAHTLTNQLIVYANGVQLNTTPYTDSNDLDGEATGVYVHTDEDDIVVKFDNFKVFRYP